MSAHPLSIVGPVWVDHVVLAVADVDDAAAQLAADHGLGSYRTSAPAGLAARIVPCGAGFLHMLALEDATAGPGLPWGAAVLAAREEERLLVSWAVATDTILPFARRTGLDVVTDKVTAPDGSPLEVSCLRPGAALLGALPTIVCWNVSPRQLPERQLVVHRVDPVGITCIDVAVDGSELRRWLGPGVDDLPVRLHKGTPGLRAVTVATATGNVVLREPGVRTGTTP